MSVSVGAGSGGISEVGDSMEGGATTLSVGANIGGKLVDVVEGGGMISDSVDAGDGAASPYLAKTIEPGRGRAYGVFGLFDFEDFRDTVVERREDSEGAAGGVEGGGDLAEADVSAPTSGVGGGGFRGGGITGGGKSAAVGEALEIGGKPAAASSSLLNSTGLASSYRARP